MYYHSLFISNIKTYRILALFPFAVTEFSIGEFSIILYNKSWFLSLLLWNFPLYPNIHIVLCDFIVAICKQAHSNEDHAVHAHQTFDKGNCLLWFKFIKVFLKPFFFYFRLPFWSLSWPNFGYFTVCWVLLFKVVCSSIECVVFLFMDTFSHDRLDVFLIKSLIFSNSNIRHNNIISHQPFLSLTMSYYPF
jgi:hypothetical protein